MNNKKDKALTGVLSFCCFWGEQLKILTVLTGGTIGSIEKNHTLDVSSSGCSVVEMYKSIKNDDTAFEVISPVNILSENMSAEYWNILINCLSDVNFSDYDGVILTHGSDTLSYTAAILGMYFAHIEIPLVMIAADYPLEYEKSNGLQNFCGAVDLIKSKTVRGAFVAYGNKEQTEIYLATRLCEADGFLDKFRDFTYTPFAVCKNGKVEFSKSRFNPSLEEINKRRTPILSKIPVLSDAVQILTPYPSFNYESVIIRENTKAVLQLTYHSGTVCTKDSGSALAFLRRCRQQGIDFYLCSLKNSQDIYITTKEMILSGAVPLYNQSREAAFAKLMLAYAQKEISPLRFTEKNIFFERIL